MKRWTWRIGIGLSALLLLFVVTTVRRVGAATTPTPTPSPTPEPNVYVQVTTSYESTHADSWTDAFGNEILLNGTDCAAVVVSYTVGQNREPEATQQEIKSVLGWPDYDAETGSGTLNLGRGGEIILDMNVYLHDSAGMFLYIFTTGKDEDRMSVSLSADCQKWYEIELKSKDFTGLDKYTNIPASIKPRYVKIRDRSESGSGVCIDAVLAFDAEPIVKVVSGNGPKKEWYEKFGMTKKSTTVLCVVVGGILLLLFLLWLIRRINIFRRKRSRKLHLVYSRARDGAVSDNSEETRGSGTGGTGKKASNNAGATGKAGKKSANSAGGKRKGKNRNNLFRDRNGE